MLPVSGASACDAFYRGDGCRGDVCGWWRGGGNDHGDVGLCCVRYAFGEVIRKGQRRRLSKMAKAMVAPRTTKKPSGMIDLLR